LRLGHAARKASYSALVCALVWATVIVAIDRSFNWGCVTYS